MSWTNPLVQALLWSAATIAFYALSRFIHRRWSRWWTTPLLLAPAFLLILALLLHEGYRDYIKDTYWLILMLGPATVAFAVPIYEQRDLIRRDWPVLVIGVLVGSSLAMITSWMLASALGMSGTLRLSLLPRSVSTPFAMTVSGDIGGVPELTAMFVILTGLCGASLGQALHRWLPLRHGLSRGALFGMGAHGVGVATASRIGSEEGSIASLVMIMAGLFNVLVAPILALILHRFG